MITVTLRSVWMIGAIARFAQVRCDGTRLAAHRGGLCPQIAIPGGREDRPTLLDPMSVFGRG